MSSDAYNPQPEANGKDGVNQDEDDISRNNADGDFDRMLAKLDKQLGALKSVRDPGKGRLTVGEAVKTALAQADAYERWCQFDAPVGVIEVWVEEQRVMALHPGDATDLRGVLFEAAGLPKAVVQVIRRADEVADTVVLLNRELRDVLRKGGRCEQRHPNDRHVTLEVKQEGKGQLSFWVGFNQLGEVATDGLGIFARLKCKAAQAGMCLRAKAERLKETLGVPTFEAAAGMLTVMLFAGFALSFRAQTGAATGVAARQPEPVALATTATTSNDAEFSAVLNEAPARAPIQEAVKAAGADPLVSWTTWSSPGATEVVVNRQRGMVVKPRLAPTRVVVTAPKDVPVPQGIGVGTLTTLPDHNAVAAESSPWDAQRLRKLAEVQSVILLVDDTATLNKEQADDLLASVRVALKELDIVALTDETEKRSADGVMLLRFEPDTTLVGAIFATMRDRDGNFLWEDHAGCRVMPDEDGWSATFYDASARLIRKLPVRTKVASNYFDAKQQTVVCSKYAKLLVGRPPDAPSIVTDDLRHEIEPLFVSQVVYNEPR